MSDSSIKSGIQFESFKIDSINFSVTPEVSVLASTEHSNCGVDFSFSFRDVFRFSNQEKVLYVTGLKVSLKVYNAETKKELAKGDFTITGLFSSRNVLDKDVEQNLVKCQGPALLFPYVRASITHTLTEAGFSTIVMPLVNINAMATNADVKIIDK